MPTPDSRSILLASGSPQRRSILDQLGLRFRVVVPEVEELSSGVPAEVARENAVRKASACVHLASPGELVLAVDTIVVLDGMVHGKPADADHAREMLLRLRGRVHHVLGGLVLLDPETGSAHGLVASTAVAFRAFSDAFLDEYLSRDEWQGRAGGYAIQGSGASLVAGIDGCYPNVVGLPVAALFDLVDAAAIELVRG